MARTLQALAAATALSIVLVAPASAALWAVLTVSPARPVAGDPAEVLIRTFATFGSDAVGELEPPEGPMPAPSGNEVLVLVGPAYPYEVRALGPGGREMTIDVGPDPGDASLYRGPVTFPEPGIWTVWLPQFGQPNSPRDLPGVRLDVDVAERTVMSPEPNLLAVIGLVALGVVAIAVLLRRRRWQATASDAR